MWFSRIGIIVLPPLAFVITKRICLSLQRADRELVLHGKETGRLVMLPHGEFIEVHEELSAEKKYTLTQHQQPAAIALVKEDARGVLNPKGIRAKLQARFSLYQLQYLKRSMLVLEQVGEMVDGHRLNIQHQVNV